MRTRYRARRDALVEAIAEELPDATVQGIAAGLHALVELPESDDEQAIVEEVRDRRIHLETMRDYWPRDSSRPPTLMLGYAKMPEPTIRAGVHEIAEAVRASRTRG
jgi:GntR family transcriptional regulator/MocR family aminotransferase